MKRLQPPRGFGKGFNSKGDKADGQGSTAQPGAHQSEYSKNGTTEPLASIPSKGETEGNRGRSDRVSSSRGGEDSGSSLHSRLKGDSDTQATPSIRDREIETFCYGSNREARASYRVPIVGSLPDRELGGGGCETETQETAKTPIDKGIRRFVPSIPLTEPHYEELEKSAISDAIKKLNFHSSDDLSNELDLSNAPRTNTGRVTGSVLRKLSHYEHGGWVVRGIDPATGETMEWGQFKLDHPRWDSSKGKPIKYDSPSGMVSRLYFLRIPFSTWELIANRYKVSMPEGIEPGDSDLSWKFWKWVKQYPEITIILTEGAKKAAALLSAGYCAIAASGIWNFTPNKQIHTDLLPFVSEGRKLYIAFDEDEKNSTRRAVAEAAKRLVRLCQGQAKVESKMMVWNPLEGKGIDDVIFGNPDRLHEIYREALSFESCAVQGLRGLSREPDVELNQRYLNCQIPADKPLVGIRSPRNTGKTETIRRTVAPIIESGTQPVIVISHRIKLSGQLAERLGLKFIENCSPEERLKRGMTLCINSLRYGGQGQIDPIYFRNAIVIIDEINQVISYLLNSSTCQEYRVEIMRCLKELLQMITDFGGQLIIADADLNETSLKLIEGLMGEKAYLIENQYQGETNFDVVNYLQSSPCELLARLYKSAEMGKKSLILTDSQGETSNYSSSNIEFKLRKMGISCLRIDGATSSDPTHPAHQIIRHPEHLKNYQCAVATGVIETGVSIDFEYYDEVYLIGNGTITTDSVCQFLYRYRIPVPRFIWLNKTGLNYIGNGAKTPKQLFLAERQKDKAIITQLNSLGYDDIEGEIVDNLWMNAWAKTGAIINSGNARYREQILEDLALEGHRIWSQEDWFKAEAVCQELSDKDEQPENHEILEIINNYQASVDCISEEKGNELNNKIFEKLADSEKEGKSVKVEVKENKESNSNRKAKDVCNAEDLSDEEYNSKSQQSLKTEAEQNSVAKRVAEKKYGKGNVNPELYKKDKKDKHYYSALRLHYHFSVGREFLNEKMGQRWDNILNEKRFIPDSNRTMSPLLKVKVLDKLRIHEVLELEEIHNNHPLAISIFESIGFVKEGDKWILSNWNPINSIKNYLGLDLSKAQSPIDAIKRIVGMLGLKMPLLKRSGSGKIRERIYGRPIAGWEKDDKGKPIIINNRAVEIDDGREDIFAVWLERDAENRDKRTEASRLRQEKELSAAAHASLVRAEIESGSLPTQSPQEVEKNEYTPQDYIEIAYEMRESQLNKDIVCAVEIFGLGKVIEAGVKWADECVRKLEWLMGHPLLKTEF